MSHTTALWTVNRETECVIESAKKHQWLFFYKPTAACLQLKQLNLVFRNLQDGKWFMMFSSGPFCSVVAVTVSAINLPLCVICHLPFQFLSCPFCLALQGIILVSSSVRLKCRSQQAICIKKVKKLLLQLQGMYLLYMHYCSHPISAKMLKSFLCMNALSKPTGFRWILNHSTCFSPLSLFLSDYSHPELAWWICMHICQAVPVSSHTSCFNCPPPSPSLSPRLIWFRG